MLIITNFEQALCMCLKILFMYQKKKEKEDHLKKKKIHYGILFLVKISSCLDVK